MRKVTVSFASFTSLGTRAFGPDEKCPQAGGGEADQVTERLRPVTDGALPFPLPGNKTKQEEKKEQRKEKRKRGPLKRDSPQSTPQVLYLLSPLPAKEENNLLMKWLVVFKGKKT